MDNKNMGDLGEEIALIFLKNKGFFLVEKNYEKKPYGEIDLVVKKDNKIYFFEVKTAKVNDLNLIDTLRFSPMDHLDKNKIWKFERIGKIYIKEKKLKNIKYHFQAILVYLDDKNKEVKIKLIDDLNI